MIENLWPLESKSFLHMASDKNQDTLIRAKPDGFREKSDLTTVEIVWFVLRIRRDTYPISHVYRWARFTQVLGNDQFIHAHQLHFQDARYKWAAEPVADAAVYSVNTDLPFHVETGDKAGLFLFPLFESQNFPLHA